jgi:hypothetical protein
MRRVFGLAALALAACSSERLPTSNTPVPEAAGEAGVAGMPGAGAADAPGGAPPAEAGGAGGEVSLAGAGAGGDTGVGCANPSLENVEVFSPSWDALGYAPYAVDGCTLVYVSAQGGGSLRLRQLATGDETVLDTAGNHPRRPTLSGGVIAWERDGAGGSEVSIVTLTPNERSRHFDHAGEPRATADAVVFTKFLGSDPTSDTDVALYDLDSDQLSVIASGPGQQRFADVSATHVAFTDFSEDPAGYFNESGSISDVVLVDRTTGEVSVRAAEGKQAFPLLGSGEVLAYLEWGAVHPEPKFSQFFIKAGYVNKPVSEDFLVKPDGPVATNPAYVRPSLHGTLLDFIDKRSQNAELFRADLRESAIAPVLVELAETPLLFGPAAAETFTLVSKPNVDQKLALFAVAR